MIDRRTFLRALGAVGVAPVTGCAASQVTVAEIETARHPVGQPHSTLAVSCDRDALTDTVTYLRARLGLAKEAKDMRLAKFERRDCRITADGRWQAR